MTHKRVKILMIERGIKQRDIATKYNIHHTDISHVISGRRNNKRIKRVIANELGFTVDFLFENPENPLFN